MDLNKQSRGFEITKKTGILGNISDKISNSITIAVSSLLISACSDGGKGGSGETSEISRVTPEQASLTSQSIAEYSDYEQSLITKNVSTILRDLGGNPNELTLVIYGDENVSYNPSTDTYTFTLPSTDKTIINNYNAIVTNSDGVTQEVVVSVTNQDLSDDSKTTFNLSDLLVENTTIVEGGSLEFSTNATDEDGFESISYKLYKDGDFYTEGTTDNLVTNSIDGLPVGSYTLEVTVTGNIGGENVIENEVTQSIGIEVVEEESLLEVSNPSYVGNLDAGDTLTNISLDISGDLENITWELTYTHSSEPGSFDKSSGVGDTLNDITFTTTGYASGYSIIATVTNNKTGEVEEVEIYNNELK